LKILELGQCSIGDLGVQFLATTLAMYSSLECLDLYENSITNIGVQYLANSLDCREDRTKQNEVVCGYQRSKNHRVKDQSDGFIIRLLSNQVFTD
jgi:hypothetical protein